jgi:exopolysaccharide biosynthesis protein
MMQDLGADEALNLDGGGSTTMVGRRAGTLRVLNDPSDSVLRNVANALVVLGP